jgi:hypothetical protein
MEPMKVKVIATEPNRYYKDIHDAGRLVNACQEYYRLSLAAEKPIADTTIDARKYCADWMSRHPGTDYAILITDQPFDDNWFSHTYRNVGIITTVDWEINYRKVSIRSYIMYHIAQALIQMRAGITEEVALKMVHEVPEGCLFDMAGDKLDVRYGMVAGNLCPGHVESLKQLGVEDTAIEALRRILNIVRREAKGTPLDINLNQVFVVMKFTTDDENDRAYKQGIVLGIEKMGLTVVRADEDRRPGYIIHKIRQHIERSFLVIAKIDMPNSENVYYELGYAHGLRKPVLLISEEKAVKQLPFDIQGFMCLLYKEGHYEKLAQDVSEWICEYFGLERPQDSQ